MKSLNIKGFSILHVLPMVAIVAIVAVIGVKVLDKSHAATITYDYTYFSCSAVFLPSNGGVMINTTFRPKSTMTATYFIYKNTSPIASATVSGTSTRGLVRGIWLSTTPRGVTLYSKIAYKGVYYHCGSQRY